MATEFRLPKLAESVVEGEIIKWFVPEGGSVKRDEPLVEVMTDKVTVELPSPLTGVVSRHLAGEGDVVAVNAVLALIDEGTGAEAQAAAAPPATPASAEPAPAATAEPEAAPADTGDETSLFRSSGAADEGEVFQVRRSAPAQAAAVPASAAPAQAARPKGPFGRVLAVPAARKLARDLGVDIEQILGSGPNGRVRVDDVRAGRSAVAPAAAGSGLPQPVQYRTPEGYEHLEERTPLRGMRRAISQQMVASHLHTVRALHVDEADVTDLVALRSSLKGPAEAEGAKLSFLPFIMKAVVSALKRFPSLNTSLDEATGEIVAKNYWNLGLAVATDTGLLVPVIRDVDEKGLLELAADLTAKAELARAGKLGPDDVRGGTFSITNIGSVGGLFSFPIINVPEAAILGVHSIKRRPKVMEDDTIVPRHMLYLSLSFDHRLVDGAEAAQFTSHVIALLEHPERLMLHMR